MNRDLLAEAKSRLPLPALMSLLGLGEHAKKSTRCPWHTDASASFSVHQRADGSWAFKCFAGCGEGDEPALLSKHRGLSNGDGCREFIRLAGIAPATPTPRSNPFPRTQSLDWSACVAAFTPEHQTKLAAWRGYSPEFVAWLHTHQLVGCFEGERIAFAVHDSKGHSIACHYRLKEDGSWRYFPTGTRTAPLVIGDLATAKTVFAFESQWDFCAVADNLGWHVEILANTAAVITRGAGNGKLLTGLCATDATLYAFAQNDPPRDDGKATPAEKWLVEVAAACGCKCLHVVTPAPHKDTNDWTLAGATRAEIEAAIAVAHPVSAPSTPPAAPQSVSNRLDTLPEEDALDAAPAPFPTDCLPPTLALMVRAVAETLRVPDALPGTMALALVAASIGKGLTLDWRPGKAPTPANLFVIPSAESGSGKSECYKLLATPFLAFERAMQDRWRKEVLPQHQADLRYAEGQLKKLDRKLAKEGTTQEEAERCRGELQFHLARIEELKGLLHEPQLSIQDATVEKAATVMHWNDETIFSTSSDARKLVDNILGRYSANKNLADDGIYLSAFSGDDVKVDRQGREGVRLANPCLTLLWALQPDALDMLLGEESLQQGGFLARCLIAHTHAEPQPIDEAEGGVPDATRARWEALLRGLLVACRQPVTLPATEAKADEPAH